MDVDFDVISRTEAKKKKKRRYSYYNNTDFDYDLFVPYVDRFR